MKTIIDPIPVKQILEELTPERFVRQTNNGKNEIYVVNAFNAPNTLREIGRLREISFRDSGGGTGLDCDLDVFDTDPDNHFEQLIVWNPYDQAIVPSCSPSTSLPSRSPKAFIRLITFGTDWARCARAFRRQSTSSAR